MRWPIVLLALLATSAAAKPAFVELKAEGPVVALAGDTEDAPPDRRVLEGQVTSVKARGDNGFLIEIGRTQRFQVGMPPKFKLPIRVGDTIRADLWLEGDVLHARIADKAGVPLVFMNEVPVGWTLTIGAPLGAPSHPPRTEHFVQLTAPGGISQTVHGWVRGSIEGVPYRIYAEAAVIDVALAARMDVKPTWTRATWSGVVRER